MRFIKKRKWLKHHLNRQYGDSLIKNFNSYVRHPRERGDQKLTFFLILFLNNFLLKDLDPRIREDDVSKNKITP